MPIFDEDNKPAAKPSFVGEDLSTLSEHELEQRIAMLEGEIERIRTTLDAKRAGRNAAASLFKR